jgi:hypothetical protein
MRRKDVALCVFIATVSAASASRPQHQINPALSGSGSPGTQDFSLWKRALGALSLEAQAMVWKSRTN